MNEYYFLSPGYDLRTEFSIWEQKVYFWNIPPDADIYWYNKINPSCLLLFVYNCELFIDECLKSGMHVRSEHQCVSELLWCSFIASIGVQWLKMSSIEYVTFAIKYCYYIIKINVAYQNNSFHMWQW